jgi:hypothetical protein
MRRVPLLLPLVAAAAVAAEPRGVLVLTDGRGGEQVLVDALRIYTRDLGRTVRLGGRAPTTLAPDELVHIAEAAGDAEVVVWMGDHQQASSARHVAFALRLSTMELRETAIEADDPPQAARALALKVRALLTSRNEAWTVTPPPPSPTPSPSPEPVVMTPSPSPQPEAWRPKLLLTPPPPSPAPQSRRRTWLEATVVYGALVPTNTDWVRHGLTVRLALPVWRLAVFVDAAFTSAPTVTLRQSTVTARVWPVGGGLQFILERPKWRISGGPRVSLQIVDADARDPTTGQIGSARRYSEGLGVLTEGVWKFSRHVAALASITAEVLVPRLELTAGGSTATDLGWVQFGFNAGLLISIP